MLERLKELPSGIDGLRAIGRVSEADYGSVVAPLFEEARREGRRIRFLYQFGPDFEGFTIGAAWLDARLGLRYLRLFDACAVVTDIAWIRDSTRLFGLMMPCPVRVFGNAERPDALAWLESPREASRLTYRILAEARVLVIEPKGPLRAEDFDALTAATDSWIEDHGELHGLVVHVTTFPGWENLAGFVSHFRFVRDHERKIKRVALAADGHLAELVPALATHFVHAKLQHFAYDKLDDAIAWARQ